MTDDDLAGATTVDEQEDYDDRSNISVLDCLKTVNEARGVNKRQTSFEMIYTHPGNSVTQNVRNKTNLLLCEMIHEPSCFNLVSFNQYTFLVLCVWMLS